MGTNYYGYKDGEKRHLGKLSSGWLPSVPHTHFESWIEDVLWADKIESDYGEVFTYEQLVGKFVSWSYIGQFRFNTATLPNVEDRILYFNLNSIHFIQGQGVFS
jgi:hypothetical protein